MINTNSVNHLSLLYIIFEPTYNHMAHRKKPQFKNPFDLEEDEEESLPIQNNNHSYNDYEDHTVVHKPLPFNPYTVTESAPQKPSKHNKNIQPPHHTTQPSYPQDTQPMSHPTSFNPQSVPIREQKKYSESELNEDGDPPLLEDIGIDPQLIIRKIKLVLRLGKPDDQMLEEADLSGPIAIALCFGMLLLLSGKIHFGDIYAIFVLGNILLYFLFNFMSQVDIIPLYSIMSTLGYALLPMLILGFCGIFASLKGNIGILLSLAVSGWASLAASNIIEAFMRQTQSNRKILLIYPIFLFYVSFAMIIIF